MNNRLEPHINATLKAAHAVAGLDMLPGFLRKMRRKRADRLCADAMRLMVSKYPCADRSAHDHLAGVIESISLHYAEFNRTGIPMPASSMDALAAYIKNLAYQDGFNREGGENAKQITRIALADKS